jgi:2-oxoglutarate dehydrogenase E2 component (dihydrolipoamide succinyltransferase)
MTIEIKVPVLPESVADAVVATWHKKPGEACERDENIVDIETDKVVLEVVAPEDGVISEIIKNEGDTVLAEEVIAVFTAGAAAGAAPDAAAESTPSAPAATAEVSEESSDAVSPAVRRILAEHNLEASAVKATGKGGRLTKEDVAAHIANKGKSAAPASAAPKAAVASGSREEKRVPMTRLRQRIAERLVDVQQTSAILTTFNEVNMKPIMDIRKRYKDEFEKTHGSRLGFMSFFVKATVEALKRYPEVNASIDGNEIVYHGYYDVGIAVSAPRGLVVPVIRDADMLGLAETESTIRDFGMRAKDNKLGMDEMTGGTFTITNGGVFGSLFATPIINPPQSAILGMHGVKERPMAVDGKVEILPMMYIALSYDHRIIDGRESVGFLKTIKELLEDPHRILLNI